MFRLPRTDWRARAACRTRPPEQFFPQNRPSKEALSPCADCPVREQCLEFALASPWPPEGIWAGLTTPQIQAAWRRRHPRQNFTDTERLLGLR